MKLSILTPIYNRKHLIQRVYASLVSQTNKNFEWIIVDDGSTDGVEEFIFPIIEEKSIDIHFYKKENGGKHTALNLGVTKAKGDYILILDSDDSITQDAVTFILQTGEEYIRNPKIAGIAGRRIFKDGTLVGNHLESVVISNSIDIRYKYHISGDLVEVFKTAVLKEFPFPEFTNEKFCPEALVWNRIAPKYDIYFTNKGFYITEYLPGGLTDKIVEIRKKSPIATTTTYAELEKTPIPVIQKIKANINYWRFSFYLKNRFIDRLKKVNVLYSIIGLPIGFLMFLKDNFKR